MSNILSLSYVLYPSTDVLVDNHLSLVSWKNRWVVSEYYKAEGHQGVWNYESPPVYASREASRGIITTGSNKQFQISCDMNRTVSSFNKTFIISYTINHIQDQYDHTEAFLKLFPEDGFNQTYWSANQTGYLRMGPEIAHMYATFHLDFFRGPNMFSNKLPISCKNDKNTHLYTLVLYPDLKFEIHVDDYVEVRGIVEDMWDFFPPRDV